MLPQDDATAFLKRAGYDQNGRDPNAIAVAVADDDAMQCRDYFDPPGDDDLDDRIRQNALEVDDIRRAAKRDEERSNRFRENGENERADEALRHAHELRQLAASTVRQVFRVHDLFSEAFTHAVNGGHWHVAQAHLIDAIRSSDADYALKVACAKALSEIVTFLPGDNGAAFDCHWLAELAGIPIRTAQDLVASARSLGSGVATILTGTEHGSRKAVREFIEMTPARQRELLKMFRSHVTRFVLEHEIKSEKRRRSRSLSITELRALTLIHLNNEEGWGLVLSLDTHAANAWLAAEMDKAIKQRVLSEESEQRGRDTLASFNSRLKRNDSDGSRKGSVA